MLKKVSLKRFFNNVMQNGLFFLPLVTLDRSTLELIPQFLNVYTSYPVLSCKHPILFRTGKEQNIHYKTIFCKREDESTKTDCIQTQDH